jgi:HEAT repeat protein
MQASVDALVGALKSPDWEARREVVSALGNIGTESVVYPLIHVLVHDENEHVRESAASWLGRIGGESAAPALVRIVKNYLGGVEHATNVVLASATALGEIGSLDGLDALKKLSTSLERSGATEARGKIAHAIKDIESTSNLANKKCIVCNLPLGNNQELVQCPFCKNMAHKDHMLEWLKGRDYCPTCRRAIKEFQLIPVQRKPLGAKPKSRSGRKKQ